MIAPLLWLRRWRRERRMRRGGGFAVITAEREDVRLEELQIRTGQIRLAGRSDRAKGAFYRPTLPSRKVLQSKFPRRKTQEEARSDFSPTWRNSASPTS